MTQQPLTFQEVEKAIFDAFRDVTKADGIGVREAIAIDDNATADMLKKAREEDAEEHWWDIPAEWNNKLDTALSFTDEEGFKFLLPVTMIHGGDPGMTRYHLCFPYAKNQPHFGNKDYINYLRDIHPQQIAEKYALDEKQCHAIALFLKWWMQEKQDYLYADREKKIETLSKSHEQYKKLPKDHYDLDLEDQIAFFDEECRTLRDWLILGNVEV